MPLPPPLGSGDGYPSRSVGSIDQIIVHHTNTRPAASPQRLAEIDIKRGQPGIRYHFVIDGSGTSFWTQPLEAALPQTTVETVNRTGVAVALAGNFTNTVPSEAQLHGAAEVIAWLISQLGIPPENVLGRSEVEPDVLSPGAQWLQGATFKDTLMEMVNAILVKGYRSVPD
jgi:N-acetyl-anhydromuramyl-L-alanine amidase AmpD